jgi:formylglycine-generating enzyme required for sulfatase activity
VAPTASAADPAAAEIAMWTAVKDSTDPLELRSYLNLYPKGRFAEAANARIAKLGNAAGNGGKQRGGTVLAEPGKTFKECDVCPDMVVVPEGTLRLAASRSIGGIGEINLQRRFGVGRFEITFEEWDACNADGGCPHKPGDEGWGRGKQPVVNVSLRDASDYVDWLSRKTGAHYRLLREAEWEYAAAAGASTRYPWGDTTGSANANCDGCGSGPSERVRTVPVGKFGRNRFGLYDVIGNAWELVDDCYSAGVKSVDPNAKSMAMDCQTAVARGGSFNTPVGDATLQRRREVGADVRSNQNSFRVARDLP